MIRVEKISIVEMKAEMALLNLNFFFIKYIKGLVPWAIMNAIINGIVKDIVFNANIKKTVKIVMKIRKCFSCLMKTLLNNDYHLLDTVLYY